MATSASSAGAQRVNRRAQRGAAMLGLLAVVVMAFAYVLTSRLNAASERTAVDRAHNAKVLNQAKQALIGWMAMNAAGTDQNPGRLPCPEAPGSFGNPSLEGTAAGNCTLPAVGRLPWRTLGLDKLVDAAGEPLWYAVSPGWALPNSTATLTINSDSSGQLSLDGSESVALVIAPGPAIAAQAGTGCTAWSQTRPAAGPPDLRNYLECENATSPADAAFVASRPGQTFNDQVLRVSSAEVIPALEAAIAERMQREIAPALASVYTSSQYGGIPAGTPMYPYATPFANPGPGTGSSNYIGDSSTYQGLLPFNQTQGCTATSSNPRCQPSLVQYAATPSSATLESPIPSGASILWVSCDWSGVGETRWCHGDYTNQSGQPARIRMRATFTNVAAGLRALDSTQLRIAAGETTPPIVWTELTPTYTATMNDGSQSGRPRGSVTITFSATLPDVPVVWGTTHARFLVSIDRAVISDHALLDPATTGPGAATSWFVRNEWFRSVYYAAAQANTAAGLPSLGCSSSNCLRINDPGTRNIRALLVLAGRSLANPAGRPNGTLTDYVENQNADGGTLYEQRPVRRITMAANANAPWNDRIVIVDWNSPLQEPAQVIDDNIPTVPVRVATLP